SLLSDMTAEDLRQGLRWVFGDLTCRIPVCFNETAWDGVGEQIDIWESLVKRGAIKVIRMPFDTGKVRRFREWFERNKRIRFVYLSVPFKNSIITNHICQEKFLKS
ncbi:MAG: hypothetical protein ABH886_05645, partial [Candidatus Desantisbacteria bacterium]